MKLFANFTVKFQIFQIKRDYFLINQKVKTVIIFFKEIQANNCIKALKAFLFKARKALFLQSFETVNFVNFNKKLQSNAKAISLKALD